MTVFLYTAPNQGAGPRLGRGGFAYDSTLIGNGGDDWYFVINQRSIIDRLANEVVTTS